MSKLKVDNFYQFLYFCYTYNIYFGKYTIIQKLKL